jgi:hypothetical protein
MADGKPKPKQPLYDNSLEPAEMKEKAGVDVWSHFVGYAKATINPSTNQPVGLIYHPDAMAYTMSQVKKDQLAFYGGTSLFEEYTKRLDNYAPLAVFTALPFPDEMSFDHANLSDYVFKNIFNVIRADSDDEYKAKVESFKADLAQFNIDAMYDFLLDCVESQREDADRIMDLYNKSK